MSGLDTSQDITDEAVLHEGQDQAQEQQAERAKEMQEAEASSKVTEAAKKD